MAGETVQFCSDTAQSARLGCLSCGLSGRRRRLLQVPPRTRGRTAYTRLDFNWQEIELQNADALSRFSWRVLGLRARCFRDSRLGRPSVHRGWADQLFWLVLVDHLGSHQDVW